MISHLCQSSTHWVHQSGETYSSGQIYWHPYTIQNFFSNKLKMKKVWCLHVYCLIYNCTGPRNTRPKLKFRFKLIWLKAGHFCFLCNFSPMVRRCLQGKNSHSTSFEKRKQNITLHCEVQRWQYILEYSAQCRVQHFRTWGRA
jgi:hypothetical protein